MAERGWDHSQAAAQMATLATRRRKDEPLRAMLETVWAERARELGLKADLAAARPRRPVRKPEDLSALEIVARTAERLEERQSVFAAHELETLALAHSPGRHTLDGIRQAVGQLVRDGHLVDATLRRADRAFVTDRTLKTERSVIAMMKAGLGHAGTLAGDDDVEARLAASDLTEGQCDAVRTILLSADRTIGVQGRAGTARPPCCARSANSPESGGSSALLRLLPRRGCWSAKRGSMRARCNGSSRAAGRPTATTPVRTLQNCARSLPERSWCWTRHRWCRRRRCAPCCALRTISTSPALCWWATPASSARSMPASRSGNCSRPG